jgi:hypothetical protein
MKIRTLIPAIIALIMLVSGPFGIGPTHDPDPRGGMICYCCSAMGKNCTMISCSGCCGSHAGFVDERWSPEMILESVPAIAPWQVAYGEGEESRSPQTVYLEVQERPPENV